MEKPNNLVELYDYQRRALFQVLAALRSVGRALMVMATGLGKTFVSARVVQEFLQPKDLILFLCHDNGILDQNYDAFREVLGSSCSYAKFYGQEKNWNADKHTFVFATFQSVLAHLNDPTKENIFSPDHFAYIIVDESHHSQAKTFNQVLEYFKPKWILGMTATPDREDMADIRKIFGNEVVNFKLPEAIANGWLTPIEYKLLSDGITKEEIEAICQEVIRGEIRVNENQLNERIFIRMRTEEQSRIIQEHTARGQRAIVFCENIEHLNHIAGLLPSTAVMHSKQSAYKNERALKLFKRGEVRHIAVVDKFNEGIHIPQAEVVAFLRATNSERIFFQQLGRILSKSPDKTKVTVLDFVANVQRIKKVKKLMSEIKRFASDKNSSKSHSEGRQEIIHAEGEGFDFTFSDEVIDILAAFDRIAITAQYKTSYEVKNAVIQLGITSLEEYKQRYKEEKLPEPSIVQSLPGFTNWKELFKQIKIVLPPDEWKSWQSLRKIKTLSFAGSKFFDFKKDYQRLHPQHFRKCWNWDSGKNNEEYYHPDFVRKIIELFTVVRLIPGWKSASSLTREVDPMSKDKTRKIIDQVIKSFSSDFTEENRRIFCLSGRNLECYSPEMSEKIINRYRNGNM